MRCDTCGEDRGEESEGSRVWTTLIRHAFHAASSRFRGSCISPHNGASYLNVAVDALLGFQRGQLPIRRHARAPTDISPSRIPFLSRDRGTA